MQYLSSATLNRVVPQTFERLTQKMKRMGWYNIERIRNLDKNTKKAINALQKKHGLQVTEFDLLHVDFDQANKAEKA